MSQEAIEEQTEATEASPSDGDVEQGLPSRDEAVADKRQQLAAAFFPELAEEDGKGSDEQGEEAEEAGEPEGGAEPGCADEDEGAEEPEEGDDGEQTLTLRQFEESLKRRTATLESKLARYGKANQRLEGERDQVMQELTSSRATIQALTEATKGDPRQALGLLAKVAGVPTRQVFDSLARKIMEDGRGWQDFEPPADEKKPGETFTPEKVSEIVAKELEKREKERQQYEEQREMQATVTTVFRMRQDERNGFAILHKVPEYRLAEQVPIFARHLRQAGQVDAYGRVDPIALARMLDDAFLSEYNSVNEARASASRNGGQSADRSRGDRAPAPEPARKAPRKPKRKPAAPSVPEEKEDRAALFAGLLTGEPGLNPKDYI